MDVRLTLRDGTVYEMPAATAQTILKSTAAYAVTQPSFTVQAVSDLSDPTRQIKWINAAEVVEIADVEA